MENFNKKNSKISYGGLLIDFMATMTLFPNDLLQKFSFWTNQDIPHLKFYLLNDEYLEIADIKKCITYEEWNINKILKFDYRDKYYALKWMSYFLCVLKNLY